MASPRVFVGEGSVVSTLGALGTSARTRSYRVQVLTTSKDSSHFSASWFP